MLWAVESFAVEPAAPPGPDVRERAFEAAGQLRLRRRTRKWRRRAKRAAIVVLVLTAVLLIVTLVQGARARGELLAARTALEEGRAAVVRNDLDPAIAAFERAQRHAPTAPLAEIAPATELARDHVAAAFERVAATPETGLLSAVAQARTEFLAQTYQMGVLLGSAVVLSDQLPAFLGAGEQRTYLFGAQSLAESRSTGGCICSYSIVTVEGGRLTFGPFLSANALNSGDPFDVAPHSEAFEDRYGRFAASGQLQQVNFTPDFPSAAAAIANLYEARTGEVLDGVIAADPYALEAIVRVTGPVDVPSIGLLTADRVVDVLSNDAYDALRDSNARKELLGEVATAALDRFLAAGADLEPARAARVLVESGGEGHLLLWSTRPEEQAAFVAAGVAGALPPEDVVSLGVFGANIATNKVDFYTERAVHITVELREDGSAVAEVVTTMTNEAPTEGLPVDVIGPNVENVEVGDNYTFLQTYCGGRCTTAAVMRDGEPLQAEIGRELGLAVVATYERFSTGASREVGITFSIPDAWRLENGEGRLELLFANQATVNPTRVRLDVVLPDGLVLHGSDPGTPQLLQAVDFATWEGLPGPRTRFAVEFGRPRDTGTTVADWLNSPLFSLSR